MANLPRALLGHCDKTNRLHGDKDRMTLKKTSIESQYLFFLFFCLKPLPLQDGLFMLSLTKEYWCPPKIEMDERAVIVLRTLSMDIRFLFRTMILIL
jgi:hypothetical protein